MITLNINTRELEQGLKRLERAAVNLKPVFEDMGQHLVNSTRRRFEEGEAPDGTPWAENSPVTLAAKPGEQPLVGESRLLSTEIHDEASPSKLLVGSNKEYAAMQQFGGKKAQFPHLWGDIPARPFMGVSDDDERELLALVHDHLQAAARR